MEKKQNKEKNLKDAPLPDLLFPAIPGQKKEEKGDPENMTVDQGIAMILEIRKKKDQVERNLDEIYALTGWSRDAVKKHLLNPDNFTPQEWEYIQSETEQFSKLLGIPVAQLTGETTGNQFQEDGSPKEKRNTKSPKARKSWIPVR